MGLRESINQNPAVTTGATIGVILITLGVIIWNTFFADGSVPPVNVADLKAFYSSDDGASFVVGPFGKRYAEDVVVANVFTCDGGKTKFIAYLERYSAEARKVLKDRQSAPASGPDGSEVIIEAGTQVKPPKSGKWVGRNSNEGAAVMKVACPGGSGTAEPVAAE